MQITGKRIFTAVMLVGTAVTTYQILSKPEPIATPLPKSEEKAAAQSFDQKLQELEAPRTETSTPAELHFTSDEVGSAIAESTGVASPAVSGSPNSVVGEGSVQVRDYRVKLHDNIAQGQFLVKISGADVYVTLAGHLGSKDGYVTFDPTEFKIGELSIPVSLVNSALQKKLVEQREQLKLPDGVESLRVENGELVLTQK